MKILNRMIGSAVLLALALPAQGQSLKSAPKPATQLKTTLQSTPQITTIPAGTLANLVVLLSPGSTMPLAEDRQVTIPVGGQVGGFSLPKGSFLMGKLTRTDGSRAILRFESLLIGNRLYTLQATSDSIAAQLVYDPAAAQQAQAAAIAAQQQGQTTNALVQTGAGLLGGFGGLFGGLFGSAQQAQTNNDVARAAASAQKFSASLGALQSLAVQFQTEVHLDQPTAELSPSGQPYSPTTPVPGNTPTILPAPSTKP
jgi:hypothetical protein